jgi:hypothetical protein
MSDLTWRKSARCEAHNCIEIAFRRSSRCQHADCVLVGATADAVHVRDSKDATGPVLTFTPDAWQAFIDGLQP